VRTFEFQWTIAEWDERLVKSTTSTVGWVLQQDRDYMVVTDESGRVTCIPRGCITKTREVVEDEPESA
jgi:predicted transcriptional regulator